MKKNVTDVVPFTEKIKKYILELLENTAELKYNDTRVKRSKST